MNPAAPALWAVVPAAGSGARMGAAVPKQYLPLAGRPLAEHTLAVLAAAPGLRELVVALAPGDAHWACIAPALRARVRTVEGGVDRADSVLRGLGGFSRTPADADWVLVHDMVRPCLRAVDITRLLEALRDDPVGGLLALPVVDTLKRADAEERVEATVPREALWRAQTPQMFRFALLREALEAARRDGVAVTDEAMAVERLGHRPRLVYGGAHNIKVTRPEDLALAEFHIAHAG
jgi:2-C-methyl-D-erythritol 4-phosphate cytidylyltransferase